MKTLLWTKAQVMEMQELEKPEVKSDEVLVKVEAAGVCGSEIEGYLGHNSLRVPPLVMGHEFAGTIAEVGSAVNNLALNDRVVVNPLISCGNCGSCRKGYENLCETRQIIGIHRPGGFAEYVAVPASCIWRIPESLDFVTASLTEPLACSLRATKRAMAANPFANVVVYGAGAIGLLSALVAQMMGASNVIIFDINEKRLETVKNSGIEHALLSNDPDLKNKLAEIVGERGVDVIIDAAGFVPTRLQAIELINNGGTIMNIGLGVDETPIPVNVQIRREITFLASFCYTKQDFYEALEVLKSGKIKHDIWSEIRTLEEGDHAFQDLINNRVTNSKIFMTV